MELINIKIEAPTGTNLILGQTHFIETGLGRGIIGIVDGEPPKGIENSKDADERQKFLQTIGYKR
ncbi:MAG: hypothetical protein J5U19_14280 [Candidatus Methanoperedens sp.]|nr:hypothetical protein [Candidatus Methanoperedens sp.]MCE8429541.1 hypothetical protein [Candidatus Methanoperedens sp.]